MGEVCSWGYGDHDVHPGEVSGGQEQAARHRVPADRGGWSATMASSTGLARANGRVHCVADVEGKLQAKGEVEGSAESTGRGDALARSGASPCASCRAWAFLGASGRAGSGRCGRQLGSASELYPSPLRFRRRHASSRVELAVRWHLDLGVPQRLRAPQIKTTTSYSGDHLLRPASYSGDHLLRPASYSGDHLLRPASSPSSSGDLLR
ncbi:hypothetical protein QYE76_041722 [Lolium multiflorum]|uniref:Uncharacterized protein n=1 Tax=Lolium multiflorum TaxID=4521 RepID=A0AAD8TDX6_LOLMU|nr:hypothetical protein QYE76_041722 [Lolium multiflorum]